MRTPPSRCVRSSHVVAAAPTVAAVAAVSDPAMPLEERTRDGLVGCGEPPPGGGGNKGEYGGGAEIGDSEEAPAGVGGHHRCALRRGSDNHERNREVNQQRVQSANQCHLPGETARARNLFHGMRPADCRQLATGSDRLPGATSICRAVCRNRSRARDNVDITVPMGTPSTADISL